MRVLAARALSTSACFYASSRVYWRSYENVQYHGQPMEVVGFYSLKEAEALKDVQSVLSLPELKNFVGSNLFVVRNVFPVSFR